MDKTGRIRACYLHACLKYAMQEEMTNTSLRKRFGFDEKSSAMASRIIRDALDEGVIKPVDPKQGKRSASYKPARA